MATYKEIKGVTLQTLDEDPVVNAGSWSSGGSMNTARTAKQSSGTGSDNAIVAGGYLATASPARQTACEVYNGTAWTEVAEANTARMFGQGGGTSTAAIISGGDTTATPPYQGITETWNGSAWTEVNDMNTGRVGHFLTGVTTAAIVGGAYPASTSVESWNGSSWTEASYDLNTAKTYMWGTGTSTAAIVSGQPNTVEQFNGSNWTEVAETNTDHREGGSGGISTDALVWGGEPGYTVNTELWDNSSWTEQNNLSTGRSYVGATENAPSTTTALAYGGSSPAQVASTEEWGFPPVTQAKLKEGMLFLSGGTTLKGFGKAASVPSVAWSSGTNLPNPYTQDAGSGSSNTAALHFGGRESGSGSTGKTQTYDGSTFTEVNDMNTARRYLLGSGTQTSTLAYGGYTTTAVANVESWDGSSWTETSDLNQARYEQKGTGKSATAALAIAANPSSPSFKTEQWNGSSWTEVAEMNTSRIRCGTAGTSTASLAFLGESPGDVEKKNEEWNGTSWTEIADLNTERYLVGSGGDGITDALAFGGNGPLSAACEYWNGSSWAEVNDLSTATYIDASAGHTSQSVMKMGGYTTTQVATTEEFTVTTATLSTVTVSQT